DRIGKPGDRSEFHRAIKPDQVDVDTLLGEMLASGTHVLRGDTKSRSAAHGVLVVDSLTNCYDHSAGRDPEIQRLVKPGTAVFVQHVVTRNAQVCCAMLHISGRVRGTNDDEPHVLAVCADYQFARL